MLCQINWTTELCFILGAIAIFYCMYLCRYELTSVDWTSNLIIEWFIDLLILVALGRHEKLFSVSLVSNLTRSHQERPIDSFSAPWGFSSVLEPLAAYSAKVVDITCGCSVSLARRKQAFGFRTTFLYMLCNQNALEHSYLVLVCNQ